MTLNKLFQKIKRKLKGLDYLQIFFKFSLLFTKSPKLFKRMPADLRKFAKISVAVFVCLLVGWLIGTLHIIVSFLAGVFIGIVWGSRYPLRLKRIGKQLLAQADKYTREVKKRKKPRGYWKIPKPW